MLGSGQLMHTQKAESGKFLETNGLVEVSMVPHKDNPKKVATGGNWAGQGVFPFAKRKIAACPCFPTARELTRSGSLFSRFVGYWVPYVVALFYARHWSYEYRYLFVLIWGNGFPDTCKKPEQQGWRDNALEGPVIAAARRESDYFLSKARALIREPGQSARKKSARSNVLFTGTQSMTVPRASEGRYHGPNTSQAFPLSPSLPRTPHYVEPQPLLSPLDLGGHTGNPALSSGYYDPVRGSRTHKLRESWIQCSDFDKEHPQIRLAMDKKHQSIGVQKGMDSPIPYQVQIDEWGKRKRCPEEVAPRLPRKKSEQHKRLLGTELSEQQTEERSFGDSGGKPHTYWSLEDRGARVHGAGKDWQMQEHEAATALMLLAGTEAELLGRAAITA